MKTNTLVCTVRAAPASVTPNGEKSEDSEPFQHTANLLAFLRDNTKDLYD